MKKAQSSEKNVIIENGWSLFRGFELASLKDLGARISFHDLAVLLVLDQVACTSKHFCKLLFV